MEPRSSPGRAEPPAEPEYANPPVAEDINVSNRRPLRSFFLNLAVIAGAILLALFLLDAAVAVLTPYIPFSWERRLAGDALFAVPLVAGDKARQDRIRHLADRLAKAMDFPEDMSVAVHYNPDPVTNAYATIGGNIVIYRGIVDMVESEDGLAMVLAHEMGHVRNRDAVRGVFRGLGMMLILIGVGDSTAYVNDIAAMGMAGYSRSQEYAADAAAVRALAKIYGHAGGATEFFGNVATRLENRRPEDAASFRVPAILASHPDTFDRLERVVRVAEESGIPVSGTLTPLAWDGE